ncbi:MAG: GIY-YIG nuclease family protein [Cetobacterium sp.]|uniref:GIY-YIG nuclease family protein n=1 Tax=Cetobacterium sp. TaxID=2071632 RepID=UPI003F345519
MYGIIYKIQNNINNKIYIGQTINLKKRIWKHKKDSKWEEKSHYPLYRAVNKYGWDNFSISKIDEGCDLEDLNTKEEFWIEFYNSIIPEFGYNVQAGGRNISCERLSEVLSKAKSNGTAHDKSVMNVTDNIIYRSGHECARQEYPNMKSKNCPIHKVCDPKSRYYKYKGKEYRYLDEYGNIIEKIYPQENSRVGKVVLCIEDDIVFDSKNKAYLYYKISKKYFNDCLKFKNGYVEKINKTFVVV